MKEFQAALLRYKGGAGLDQWTALELKSIARIPEALKIIAHFFLLGENWDDSKHFEAGQNGLCPESKQIGIGGSCNQSTEAAHCL